MDHKKSMGLSARAKSFGYAFEGLASLIKKEPNMRIHLAATVVVIIAGVIQGFVAWKWVALSIIVGIVWITEAINTAIETLCDLVCDHKFHPAVKIIKDISAAVVLIAALTSVFAGVILFIY